MRLRVVVLLHPCPTAAAAAAAAAAGLLLLLPPLQLPGNVRLGGTTHGSSTA
jgi:hypothetical protein